MAELLVTRAASRMAPGTSYDVPWASMLSEAVPALVLPTIAIAMRFWGRWILPSVAGRRFWWDDWFALATLPFIYGTICPAIYWMSIGFGQHIWDLKFKDFDANFKFLYAQSFLWHGGMTMAKFSVICFYARVFPTPDRKWRAALWTVAAINGAWEIAAFFSSLFQCTPIQRAWRPLDFELGGHCIDYYQWFIWMGGINMGIDALVLLLPMPMLYKLQLPWTRKLLVLVVFSAGYAYVPVEIKKKATKANGNRALACAIVRQVVLVRLGPGFILDPMYNVKTLGYVVMIETPICVLAVCMPVIYALFHRMYRHGLKSTLSSGASYGYGPESGWASIPSYRHWPKHRSFLQREEAAAEAELYGTQNTFSAGTIRKTRSIKDMMFGDDIPPVPEIPKFITVKQEFEVTVEGQWDEHSDSSSTMV